MCRRSANRLYCQVLLTQAYRINQQSVAGLFQIVKACGAFERKLFFFRCGNPQDGNVVPRVSAFLQDANKTVKVIEAVTDEQDQAAAGDGGQE